MGNNRVVGSGIPRKGGNTSSLSVTCLTQASQGVERDMRARWTYIGAMVAVAALPALPAATDEHEECPVLSQA